MTSVHSGGADGRTHRGLNAPWRGAAGLLHGPPVWENAALTDCDVAFRLSAAWKPSGITGTADKLRAAGESLMMDVSVT